MGEKPFFVSERCNSFARGAAAIHEQHYIPLFSSSTRVGLDSACEAFVRLSHSCWWPSRNHAKLSPSELSCNRYLIVLWIAAMSIQRHIIAIALMLRNPPPKPTHAPAVDSRIPLLRRSGSDCQWAGTTGAATPSVIPDFSPIQCDALIFGIIQPRACCRDVAPLSRPRTPPVVHSGLVCKNSQPVGTWRLGSPGCGPPQLTGLGIGMQERHRSFSSSTRRVWSAASDAA